MLKNFEWIRLHEAGLSYSILRKSATRSCPFDIIVEIYAFRILLPEIFTFGLGTGITDIQSFGFNRRKVGAQPIAGSTFSPHPRNSSKPPPKNPHGFMQN